jgi:antitoxin (DNA-binding transcriptional repressor) of toxin-antitoxin stability system
MKKARISQLKNRLSYYLRQVRKGQPLLVYDRDRVIARIDPIGGAGAFTPADGEVDGLGQLRPPIASLPADWQKAREEIGGDVVAALLTERQSGR